MITLYTFGPGFGLPDPSAFVTKAEVLLKLSGLDYKTDTHGFNKAPKGKLPYINDNGTIVADSLHIRWHLENKHNIKFSPGLSDQQRAISWAFERMCEEDLYWAIVNQRWLNDDNFNKGPRKFFQAVPAVLRPLVTAKVRRDIKRNLWGHGLGRHTDTEIAQHAAAHLKAISDFLGDNPWLMGANPTAGDATVFAFVTAALSEFFAGPVGEAARSHTNLVAYRERGMNLWFPDFTKTT